MDAYQRIVCKWCNGQNTNPTACAFCGAPLDVQNLVSQSGWREAPRLRDMTQIHFDQSTCQVEGEIVPVVEINLAPNEWVYFEHHCMLWKGGQRAAHRDEPAGPQAVVLPHAAHRDDRQRPRPDRVQPRRDRRDCRPASSTGHGDGRSRARFPPGERSGRYSYERIKGLANILHGGNGMWLDRFVSQQGLGLLVLHGYGNVFERTLAPGESIQVEPGSMLYKDASVTLQAEAIKLSSGIFGGTSMYLARLTGPGRVGIQSMYHHHESGE